MSKPIIVKWIISLNTFGPEGYVMLPVILLGIVHSNLIKFTVSFSSVPLQSLCDKYNPFIFAI